MCLLLFYYLYRQYPVSLCPFIYSLYYILSLFITAVSFTVSRLFPVLFFSLCRQTYNKTYNLSGIRTQGTLNGT